jgi:type II secretory pathway component PulC
MKRFGILNILLVGLIALAGWRLIDVVRREPPLPSPDGGALHPAGGDVPNSPRRQALVPVVESIHKSDLFDVSRKPPELAAGEPTPVQTPAPPPTLKLSGVIFVGNFREAVVIDEAQGRKQLRLREGEEISGYEVVSIERERVALRSGHGEEVQLELLVDTRGPQLKHGPGGRAAPKPTIGKRGRNRSAINDADGKTDIEKRRVAARSRAQRARERLKRLREEAARRK